MAFASDKGRQGAAGVSTGYDIDNSLRFDTATDPKLLRTPSSASNRKTWTMSMWIKRNTLGFATFFRGNTGSVNNYTNFAFTGSDELYYLDHPDNGDNRITTNRLFRDLSAWYHIVLVMDTTQGTASNRFKLYVNGVQETSFSDTNYPTLNQDLQVNAATEHSIGDSSKGMYVAEVNFVDGQALTPADFGETDATYGHWKPIEYAGTYGTNGFYLDFSNKGTKYTITANGNVQHDTARSKIGSSSIEFDGASDYLSIPQNADWAFGDGDFTIEYWVNMWNTPSSTQYQHLGQENGADYWRINHSASRIELQFEVGGSTQLNLTTSGSQITAANVWYHIALVKNGSTATCYLDGTSVGSSTWSGNMGEVAAPLLIGNYRNYATGWMDGFMDEIRISNTARYTSSFTPSTTAFTDDSNTLLLIHSDTTNGSTTFTDDSGVVGGLGNDASSNTNNWTPNNLSATDQMLDSPTNNFCTLNVVNQVGSSLIISEGNTNFFPSASTGTRAIESSMSAPSSGKYYFEICTVSKAQGNWNYGGFGLKYTDSSLSSSYSYGGAGTNYVFANLYHNSNYGDIGTRANFWTNTNQPATLTVFQVAVDSDNDKIYLGKNNTWYGSADPANNTGTAWLNGGFGSGGMSFYFSGTLNQEMMVNFGQDSSFAGNKTAQGNQDSNSIGDFYYTPPTDFLALCTSNLPDPAVIPSEHFNTVTYTGNGSTQSITGVGFQPDFTWIKARSYARHHWLWNSISGVSRWLQSSNQDLEAYSSAKGITSFDSDGFTYTEDSGQGFNTSSQTEVAWNWKANGAGVSNTDGSIASTVSANVDAGFSIVSWANTGSAVTIGHGLSSTPELIISKMRSASGSWFIHSKSGAATQILRLEGTYAFGTHDVYNNTYPTSSVFSYKHGDAEDFIAYCFHSVEGYSKVGSYTGNGSTDGTFVYTGFRPAYVMMKRTDSTGDWYVWDSVRNEYNLVTRNLVPNKTNTEFVGTSNYTLDFTSNGFKHRGSGGDVNASGGSYIYLAFAENPFKYTNAR